MSKGKGKWLRELAIGMGVPLLLGMATPAYARGISMKDAGIALWVFIIIGAVIVLLQLIPAGILFFSFIGTSSSILFRKKKVTEELVEEEKEKVLVPGYEPAPVKK